MNIAQKVQTAGFRYSTMLEMSQKTFRRRYSNEDGDEV